MTGSKIFKILQKYTKTDLRYLTRGSFWLTTNQGVTMVITFLLAVAFANIVPPEVYGNYKFILSLATIVGAFSLTGLYTAVVRDAARGVPGLLKTSFQAQLRWSIGTLFVSLCIALYYYIKGNFALTSTSLMMGLAVPLISSLRAYIPFLEGKQDYRRLAIFNIITTLVYTITLFIIIHISINVQVIIFFYFLTQLLCSYIFYKITLYSDTDTSNTASETVRFGKDLSLLNLLTVLVGQIDKIFVFHFLGAVDLAVYAFSQVPIGQVRTFLRQAAQLALPKYSEKTIVEIKSSIYRKMLVFTLVSAITVGGYILLAPLFFKIFFPKYLDAVLYSQVAMLSLLFLQKKLISYAALAHATKKQIYMMSISSSIFKIVLLVILVPLYGIWGAIFTELIGQAVGFIASMFLLRRLR